MIKVYFNEKLQRQSDILNILDDAEIAIVREDGFSSTEQILREKFESTISFTGLAYSYVCGLIKENPCVVIDVRIEFSCDLQFSGTMALPKMEFTIGAKKCICKVGLKDNSFSGYIRDYLNTDVALYNTKTLNCELLETVPQNFLMPNDPLIPGNTTQIIAFDVLDVLKYMIAYYTDNRFTLASNFLTTNKYAITTGFNMHNSGTTRDNKFPTLTFQKIFDEIRKKLRIYMSVEYDTLGAAYLRVEEEEYFYANVELFSIPDIQKDSIHTYDIKRNFNQINIGSETYEMQDEEPVTYPQRRYTAWNKESYGGCGTCTGDKDSKLELVSDFIIDSNIIYEAVLWSPAADYPNDDSIFLFEYEVVGTLNYGKVTLETGDVDYYYNASITNENVLQYWLDYYASCLAILRAANSAFYAQYSDYVLIPDEVTPSQFCKGNFIEYPDIIYDNLNALSVQSITHSQCGTPQIDSETEFEVPANGLYNFQADVINIVQNPVGGAVFDLTFSIFIRVYQDNTHAVLLYSFVDSFSAVTYTATPVSLMIQTGDINLLAGNVVTTEIVVLAESADHDLQFTADTIIFQLVADEFSCITIDYIDQNSRPYTTTFDYQICPEQYKLIQQNNRAYITVAGYKQWIKEVKYRHLKKSTLTLVGNDLLCGC